MKKFVRKIQGFGQKAQRGFVTLEVNDVAVQMDTKKAQEVGLMLRKLSRYSTHTA